MFIHTYIYTYKCFNRSSVGRSVGFGELSRDRLSISFGYRGDLLSVKYPRQDIQL